MSTSDFELDVAQLHAAAASSSSGSTSGSGAGGAQQQQQQHRAAGGDVFLLRWLAKCETAVSTVSPDELRKTQRVLLSSLLSLLACPSSAPNSVTATAGAMRAPSTVVRPGRPARESLARIAGSMLERGDGRMLFDTVSATLRGMQGLPMPSKLLNPPKDAADDTPTSSTHTTGAATMMASDMTSEPSADPKDVPARVACAHVLAAVFRLHGHDVMSLFLDVVVACSRLAKQANSPVILRAGALTALHAALRTGSRSLSDAALRDVLKTLRALLSDKAGAVVRGSAMCLVALADTLPRDQGGAFATAAEIDASVQPALKALEGADHATRRSLSDLCAALLAMTQDERPTTTTSQGTASSTTTTATTGEEKTAAHEDDGLPSAAPGRLNADEGASTTATDAAASTSGGSGERTLCSPRGMLALLSGPYNRPTSSRRLRNGILDVYAALFARLGPVWVEMHCAEVIEHLVSQVACGAAAGSGSSGWNARVADKADRNRARYDALAARHAAALLLADVLGKRVLSEPGQVVCVRELARVYLRKWPALMPGTAPPSKQALVVALDAVAALLKGLGSVPPPVQDTVHEHVVRLASHPSFSVHIAAARALSALCDAAPARLAPTLSQLTELLNRELATLQTTGPHTGADVRRKAVGLAHALAALVALVPRHALYVSFDVSARLMSLAVQLLKQSAQHDLHVSATEINVAWSLAAALMALGPNFVRLHVPQLMILWRAALPKPPTHGKEAANRPDNEWAFLLHVRECALSAILSFVQHDAQLVTDDVARRIVALLSHALAFSNQFASARPSVVSPSASTESLPTATPAPGAAGSALSLLDRDIMLRRRITQCFVALGNHPATGAYQTSLLAQAVSVMSDPDRYAGTSPVQAAIHASAGQYNGVWQDTDGFGFGVSSLMRPDGVANATDAPWKADGRVNRDTAERAIEDLLQSSILGAAEFDPLALTSGAYLPPPPAVALTDAAVELFATHFASQTGHNQTLLLQQLVANSRVARLERNPGRRMAIMANSTTAILMALRACRTPLDVGAANTLKDALREPLLHPDARLRSAASEAVGRLAALTGTAFMAGQVQFCVNQVVSSTDPASRAGCALALAEIYAHVGSLAASPILKTVVDVLVSLSADPHPLVHYYALQALSHVVSSASLAYAPFTTSTLGLLAKLYMSETHEPEGGTPGSVNLRSDLPALQAFCRVIDSLIRVIGPELQPERGAEPNKVQELVMILVREFMRESAEGVAVEATKATQHILMFAPALLDQAELVATLRSRLGSSRQPLRLAAVNSVYQLVQRDAVLMSKLGGDGLVQDLFALLDDDPSIEGVRAAIKSWLAQTADANPSGWIDLCQRIMSRSDASQRALDATAQPAQLEGFDEESQGLGVDAGERPAAKTQTTSRWRTQLFALECLHHVFVTVVKRGRPEHFDVVRARALRANRRSLLISRVADLIKMAFTASTAQVMQIRLEGLVVLRDVIQSFARSQDIDFEEALLLEQYQAQIAAALTPAFASDSYPEVLASAIQVCAVFVGSGVVQEVSKMGRILKLLTTALESCKETNMSSLGDVKDLSATAAVMLKTSIFAAWAELEAASVRQPYLVDVVKPHLPLLATCWVATLREYARMSTDPDAAASEAGVGGSTFDSVYSGLSRETALPFYEASWAPMLQAVAVMLKAKDPIAFRAVDGKDSESVNGDEAGGREGETGGERKPARHFWILSGLAYEALCTTSPTDQGAQRVQTNALEAIEGLLQPAVAADALEDQALVDELCHLCYRLVATEPTLVKIYALRVSLQLARAQRQRGASIDISARVAVAALQQCTKEQPNHARLLTAAFGVIGEMADMSASATEREELYCVALQYYAQLLELESVEDLVGPTLPTFKAFVERAFSAKSRTLLTHSIQGLMSFCLRSVESVRSREGAAAKFKMRNNMLVTTLLISSLPSSVKLGEEVIRHMSSLLGNALLADDDVLSNAALYCVTSLVMASARAPTPLLRFCVGQTLPYVLQRLTTDDDHLGDLLKLLTAALAIVEPSYRTQALSVTLPLLTAQLAPEVSPPSTRHSAVTGHLLALASSQSAAFKAATESLSPEMRSTLETSVRARVGIRRDDIAVNAAPTIELRSFG